MFGDLEGSCTEGPHSQKAASIVVVGGEGLVGRAKGPHPCGPFVHWLALSVYGEKIGSSLFVVGS